MKAIDKLNDMAKALRRKEKTERVNYLYSIHSDKAARLDTCASWVLLRYFEQAAESKILKANLCKLGFLCEICAVRRQGKLFARAVPRVEKVLAADPHLKPVLITMGLKTGPDLRRQFERLTQARNRMTKAVARTLSRSTRHVRDWEFCKVKAQIRSMEIKRAAGDGNHWNVHMHIFALVSEYIDQEKLSAEWLELTEDSFIVDVRAIHAKGPGCDRIASGLSEVIKYPLKFAGLKPCDAWEAHCSLAGRRMTDTLGLLRGINPGDLERDDDNLFDESGPYRDFIATWLREAGHYDLKPWTQPIPEERRTVLDLISARPGQRAYRLPSGAQLRTSGNVPPGP